MVMNQDQTPRDETDFSPELTTVLRQPPPRRALWGLALSAILLGLVIAIVLMRKM